jgi:hypothetical protein
VNRLASDHRAFGLVLLIAAIALMTGPGRLPWPLGSRDGSCHAWRVDLDLAPGTELRLLPGIGEVRSGAIMELRSTRTGLQASDLLQVPGIGAGTIARLDASGLIRRLQPVPDGR